LNPEIYARVQWERLEPLPEACVAIRLEDLNVLGLKTFCALYHLELHCLAFLQTAKAVRLDGGEMYEYIFAVLTADEAVPLASLNHFTVPCSTELPFCFFLDFC
jgi:hypothetical protein